MQTLKFIAVPVIAVSLWLATAASVLTHLDSMSRSHQAARTPATAAATVTASR